MDVATLAVSSATLACDWGQTRSAASAGWMDRVERNPLMGAHPSTIQVDMYFGVVTLLNVTLWAMLPKRWRSVVPIGVGAFEMNTIVGNVPTTESVCGVGVNHGRS